MSKIDKAKERLSLHPKDYTYSEAKYLLSQLDLKNLIKGKHLAQELSSTELVISVLFYYISLIREMR